METVPFGNAGNPGESSGGAICGAVGYTYSVGKYEVTAGQYCDFLNAVAETDPYELYSPTMDSYAFGCQITRNGSDGNYTYDFSGRPSGTGADWVSAGSRGSVPQARRSPDPPAPSPPATFLT